VYTAFLGITRLERWERAEEYGLYPPREVKTIILQHPNDTKYTEWYVWQMNEWLISHFGQWLGTVFLTGECNGIAKACLFS